mmetsp:Transcript_47540/g.94531  ORF Transcript_47540/g.94531 Transcript_47540/m.94531 type:complete len:198 (-) Transcript_47540:38-631(-)
MGRTYTSAAKSSSFDLAKLARVSDESGVAVACHRACCKAKRLARAADFLGLGTAPQLHPPSLKAPTDTAAAFAVTSPGDSCITTSGRSTVSAFVAETLSMQGDLDTELCAEGESIRVDDKGMPYLVDMERRHYVHLNIAILISVITMVGTVCSVVSNLAKTNETAAEDETAEEEYDYDEEEEEEVEEQVAAGLGINR